MKECAKCGEKVSDHAVQCSSGHMVFLSPRGVQYYSPKPQPYIEDNPIEQIIRKECIGYPEKKIKYLIKEITSICENGHIPVTNELITAILKHIEDNPLQKEPIREKEVIKIEKKIEQRKRLEREAEEKRMQLQKEAEERKRNELILRRQREDEEFEKLFNLEGAAPSSSEYPLRDRELVNLLADALNLVVYKRADISEDPITIIDRIYRDNRAFWQDAQHGALVQGMKIHLQGFHITEWIPSSPGRFYTPEAMGSRRSAQNYVDSRRGEYLPLGKGLMILGGVGSVRLGDRSINSEVFYPLGASSTGVSHQGIPVMLAENEYHKVMPFLQRGGGCLVNLTGRLRVFQRNELLIQYDRQIPKYVIYVEQVEVLQPSDSLIVTVALAFSTREDRSRNNKHWSFCSFNPITEKPYAAVNWLEEYAIRRFQSKEILSDFDEHHQYFNSISVEFPVSNVLQGNINIVNLRTYESTLNFQINEEVRINMGDIFSNITGSTIVNKSSVEASFNKIHESYDEETAKALLRVAEEVAKSNNKVASELFASFNDELQKPEPKKSVLRQLWDGLVATLPSIAQIADVVLNISKLFSPQ